MHHKTVSRIADAILHGEDPGSSPDLRGWIDRTGGRCRFGDSVGSVLGISIMRESIGWMVAGVTDALGEGRRDAPVLPLNGPPTPPGTLRNSLADVFRDVAVALPGKRVGYVGVAWVGPIGPLGEARDYPVHHSKLGDERNRPLATIVHEALVDAGLSDPASVAAGLPAVVVINDADADLLYEARRGKARGVANAMGVKVAGGIGLSLMYNHQLVRGARGSAGEIEHVQVAVGEEDELKKGWSKLVGLQDLPDCACTGSSCVGRFASGAAIIAQLSGYVEVEKTPTEIGRDMQKEPDNGVVSAVCGRAGTLLGEALLVPAMALDPERIVVSAFPRNKHLSTAVGTRLTQGMPLRLGLDDVVEGSDGEITPAGAAQWAIEARVVPAIEAGLRPGNLTRHDVPSWMRLQVPVGHPVFAPPFG